mgnify:CR=1 FL=1
MKIINNKTVTVSTGDELKNVLENNNGYEYIYLEDDITLKSGIRINSNKSNITINGTYQNTIHTLTGMDSSEELDTISTTALTKQVKIINMKIINTNIYGIICVPEDDSYEEIVTIYDNIIFNGTQLSFNPYGTVKITNSVINIEDTNGIKSQEVCEAERVIIGGKTNISSSSSDFQLFAFRSDSTNPYVIFLCKSEVIISTDSREFMVGTNKLNFTILHDTKVHLTTGNGFASLPRYGVNNVLIDERASFIFIEKSHQRIPMWAIFGSLTMKEDSELQIINSYDNTPSDNYNIHFKGTDCKINLYNPKNLTIYTKNSNVIYTDNPLTYYISCSRINMWQDSIQLSNAGDINNLPDYSWYKDNGLLIIEGTITSALTSITKYNITTSELAKLPNIGNFTFQNRKQLSIGTVNMNIHPINSTKNTISGHTDSFADVLIKYNGNSEIVNADDNGLFEYNITSSIPDNTTIELTSNVSGSFIYGTRTVTTPFTGELSLLEVNQSIDFANIPINNTYIFPKTNDLKTKIVDSRLNSSDWKLYAYINNPLTSANGFILENALVFKKFDNEIITLTSNPTLVFTGENNKGIVSFKELNWSTEKGPLLDLTNDALEANEEYFAAINFSIEE